MASGWTFLDVQGNPLPDDPPTSQPFANPDHAKQLRGRDGCWVETPALASLPDEALETLLDEVVEEALLRKAGKKQDPLEYD